MRAGHAYRAMLPLMRLFRQFALLILLLLLHFRYALPLCFRYAYECSAREAVTMRNIYGALRGAFTIERMLLRERTRRRAAPAIRCTVRAALDAMTLPSCADAR